MIVPGALFATVSSPDLPMPKDISVPSTERGGCPAPSAFERLPGWWADVSSEDCTESVHRMDIYLRHVDEQHGAES